MKKPLDTPEPAEPSLMRRAVTATVDIAARIRASMTREDEQRYTAPGALGYGAMAELARANIAEREARQTLAPRKAVATRPRVAAIQPRDDDADDEMRGDSPIAQARQAERARCASIVLSPEGLAIPGMAQALAFQTRMTRGEAVDLMHQLQADTSQFSHLAKPGARGATVPARSTEADARRWDAVFARTAAERTAARPTH